MIFQYLSNVSPQSAGQVPPLPNPYIFVPETEPLHCSRLLRPEQRWVDTFVIGKEKKQNDQPCFTYIQNAAVSSF